MPRILPMLALSFAAIAARSTALAQAGDVLTPGRIALLAATGTGAVHVSRRPVVGVSSARVREGTRPPKHCR